MNFLHIRSLILCYLLVLSVSSGNKMAEGKTALVLIADGSEEMEAVISIDVLRRAGLHVTVGLVSGTAGIATCGKGVKLAGDVSFAEAESLGPYDVVVVPGGMGGSNIMAADSGVKKLLSEQYASGRKVAAICAAPALVLTAAGVGEGKRVTCYPSMESHFGDKYTYVAGEKVVVDGNLITSQGPGTAFDFALKVAEEIVGAEKSKAVAKAMLL
ncbi:protein dj-1beta [Hyalella azteca]|uniref:Protein dj-1beta n=1 Tax=Hyalella azteca TaxID=294128 RepID=A0A8B7P2V2_HYAAZ|nr:protein dj-1beta [Hyalella azteca]